MDTVWIRWLGRGYLLDYEADLLLKNKYAPTPTLTATFAPSAAMYSMHTG
jgi:hypothetical protein